MAYSKTTDFASKDDLITGDPNKVILGAELDTEFENIQQSFSDIFAGNMSLGDGSTDTVTVPGYFDGTVLFGTSAWPTTTLGKTGDRVLFGNEGMVALWNETAGAGNYASLLLGTKHASVSTAMGYASIRAGTEGTDYASFWSVWLQNGAGALSEKLKIASTGYMTAPGVYANTSASAANVFVDSSGVLHRSTSSLNYKEDVRPLGTIDVDLFQPIRYKSKKRDTDGDRDYLGFIAEDLHAAGLGDVVQYDADGEPDGVMYERIVVVLMAEIQALRQRVAALETA